MHPPTGQTLLDAVLGKRLLAGNIHSPGSANELPGSDRNLTS